MIQRDYPERDSKPEREQLSELYWESYEPVYSPGFKGPFFVLPRGLVNHSVRNPGWDLQQQGFTFFVWGADLKKCFGVEIADVLKPPPDKAQVPKKASRRRIIAEHEKRPPRIVGEAIVADWCKEKGYRNGVPKEVATQAVWRMMATPPTTKWDAMCVKLGEDPNKVRPPKSWHTVDAWLGRR